MEGRGRAGFMANLLQSGLFCGHPRFVPHDGETRNHPPGICGLASVIPGLMSDG